MSSPTEVAKHIESICRKGGAPLSSNQFMLVAGCLAVFLEQAREQGREEGIRQAQQHGGGR